MHKQFVKVAIAKLKKELEQLKKRGLIKLEEKKLEE